MAGKKGDLGSSDDTLQNSTGVIGLEERMASSRAAQKAAGGGSGYDPIEPRITHLEARMDRVEGKLDTIIDRLGGIATRTDMRNYVFLAIGLFVAVVAILVSGMGWLETRVARVQPAASAAPQPIVIQLPSPQPVTVPSKR